jgi:hypothetical protein
MLIGSMRLTENVAFAQNQATDLKTKEWTHEIANCKLHKVSLRRGAVN